VQRIVGVADDERRSLDPDPVLLGRCRAAEEQALEHVGRRLRVLAHPVEHDVDQVVRTRDPARDPRHHLERGCAEPQPGEDRGEDHRHGGEGVLEHRHLDEEPADPIRVPGRELEPHVCAQRGSPDHGSIELQVVEQGQHLVGECGHRVEPRVRGAVRAPVAQQIEANHAIPPRRDLGGEALVHAPVHQQPVDQNQGAIASPEDVVGDFVLVLVPE
jgi:hypothetical protein